MNLDRIILSKSGIFLTLCFCFGTGVAVVSVWDMRLPWKVLFFILCGLISFCIAFWNMRTVRLIALALISVWSGVIRYDLSFPNSTDISWNNGSHTRLHGFIAAEPDVRADGVRYIVRMDEKHCGTPRHYTNPARSGIGVVPNCPTGNIFLSAVLSPQYHYGDIVDITCDVEAPQPFLDVHTGRLFRYDKYLARYGVFSICKHPRIWKSTGHAGSRTLMILYTLKEHLLARINHLWHEPYAGLMSGLLFGSRDALESERAAFEATGATHIAVIDGLKIMLLLLFLKEILIRLYVPRQRACFISAMLLFLFAFFVGFSGSVLRASMMALLVLCAEFIGRPSKTLRILVVATAVLLLFNPLLLLWDVGFQLSFLSTLGITQLRSRFDSLFIRIPNVFGLRESLSVTLAAILPVLPLIAYQFGIVSFVAIIVNVLIVWTVPWLMLLGMCAIAGSFLRAVIGDFFAYLALAGMSYVMSIVHFFARLPIATLSISLSLSEMMLAYAGLLLLGCLCLIKVVKEERT